MSIYFQTRDFNIFKYMATLGFVTVNQLCAFLEPNGRVTSKDISRQKGAIYKRLHFLSRDGYISSGPAPAIDSTTIKAYFLAPAGARVLSDLREVEYSSAPRWLEKKKHFVWTQGPHDLAAGNFISNLVGLARLDMSYSVDNWRGGRDCRFYIPNGDGTRLFNPDLYLEICPVECAPIPMFLEIDTGNVSLSVIRRKGLRVFQYFTSGQFIEDLGTGLFPRTLFVVQTQSRMSILMREMRKARDTYKGPDSNLIREFPFWFATYDDIELDATDRGRLTRKPLEGVWRTLDGEKCVTPFKE